MQQQCTTALKNAKKNQKIWFKSKKSDLNQKNLIFSDFLLKIMIFSKPDGNGVKTLIEKTDMTGSIDWQRGVVVHTVCVRLPTSTKLRVSTSAKKINHRHTVHNGKLRDRLACLWVQSTQIIENDLQLTCLTFHQSIFNFKTYSVQTCEYDVFLWCHGLQLIFNLYVDGIVNSS